VPTLPHAALRRRQPRVYSDDKHFGKRLIPNIRKPLPIEGSMKKLLVLGAAVIGFTFLGQADAKAADYCAPRPTVVIRGGYPVYAPAYYGGYGYYGSYGYYHRPYRPHYVRYVNPYRHHQPRVAYSHGY
jgi:hypothetical protein